MPTTTKARTVTCPNCGRVNRTPAAAAGRPRCGNCHAYLPWIADAGDDDFAEIAEQASIPVLVDLWATWCGPCRMVSPALEQLATERAGQLKLVKVDIDTAPELARKFSVQAVPTLMVMYRGEVIARQPGAAPVNVLRQWVDEAISRIPSSEKSTDSTGSTESMSGDNS
jgi:thioredoxin 2